MNYYFYNREDSGVTYPHGGKDNGPLSLRRNRFDEEGKPLPRIYYPETRFHPDFLKRLLDEGIIKPVVTE